MEMSWRTADLVALDLEGSGPQDPVGEAILEIAVVPLRWGQPDLTDAYDTLINPERKIVRKPWISPGITNAVLAQAPTLDAVEAEIGSRVTGKIIVGHNIGVDWRLLRRYFSDLAPQGLIDTLKLARKLNPQQKSGHSLTAWIERLGLKEKLDQLAPGSQPHRAQWDALAAALLLTELLPSSAPDHSLDWLLGIAGISLSDETRKPEAGRSLPAQEGLWD